MRVDRLFHEVHRLAAAYHWAERDVLGLSWRRRQRYLTLIERDDAHLLTQELSNG